MVIAALLIFFWAVVPGLITGWMLRERGRSFLPGFLIGAVCGPLGILGVLTFIYFADRRRARERGKVRGHAVRVFYEVPVVGRLHVSTVWALAGVATFLCLWMIGGITYESYRAGLTPSNTTEPIRRPAAEQAQAKSLLPPNAPAEKQPAESRLTEQAQANTSSQTRSALIGNFSGQSGQRAVASAPTDNAATSWQPTLPSPSGPAAQAPQAPAVAPAAAVTTQPAAPPPPAKAPMQIRADAVAEVTRDLASRGHRVHAALSGDAQTATLSLTGATLTREASNQLLGNSRLRGALKAVGVRIVVFLNGEQSWTYIL